MAKHKFSPYDYPLIIKRHLQFITFSIPDLGVLIVEDVGSLNSIDKETVYKVGLKVFEIWAKSNDIIKAKSGAHKYIEKPSNIRNVVEKTETELTPHKFSKYVGVSKETIIRDCKKGLIGSRRTSGGHFKIPYGEIAIYKAYLHSHVKHATESWSVNAANNMRNTFS